MSELYGLVIIVAAIAFALCGIAAASPSDAKRELDIMMNPIPGMSHRTSEYPYGINEIEVKDREEEE